MVDEARVAEGFRRAKEDIEGIKNELAFTLKRIARIEEVLTKRAIEESLKKHSKKKKK